MIILGIETSCDETSAAVLCDGEIRSNIVSSQLVHEKYGGVVPELASRAHQRLIVPVVEEALQRAGVSREDLTAIAVTRGPGLMGALLVGLNFARAMAYGLKIPLLGINHMEAHLYSNFIDPPRPEFPLLCLIVSGGHTQLILVTKPFVHRLLGETLDDAAGEAFDKVAKMLGLGFPGGPAIDRLARTGNPDFVKFPRSFLEDGSFGFSFSGVKTAMLYWLRDHQLLQPGGRRIDPPVVNDLCASFQAAVLDVLVTKTLQAQSAFGVRHVGVAGGVAANSALRHRMEEQSRQNGFTLHIPKFEYCTDNGAMIAMAAFLRLREGVPADSEVSASANLSL